MKTYQVKITEILERYIYVDAENSEEAEQIVKNQYWRGNIILDSSDYAATNFEVE